MRTLAVSQNLVQPTRGMELGVTANKMIDMDFTSANENEEEPSSILYNNLELNLPLASNLVTPKSEKSKSLVNPRGKSSKNINSSGRSNKKLSAKDKLSSVNQKLKERIKNIKNMQGVVSKYFKSSKKKKSLLGPNTDINDSQTRSNRSNIRKSNLKAEVVESRSMTPPNK
jgi:hypothetical protein